MRLTLPERLPPQPFGRTFASVVFAVLHLIFGALHFSPSLIYRNYNDPAQTSALVIAFITERLGPVWVVLYLLTGAALILAIAAQRAAAAAHALAASAWGCYSTALWVGALATKGPIAWPILTSFLILLNYALVLSYAGSVRRPEWTA